MAPTPITWRCAGPCLVAALALLAMLACSMPATETSTMPPTVDASIAPTAHINPDVSPTEGPTLVPSETPKPPDPLAILDAHASLARVGQRLDALIVTHKPEGVSITGRELLRWILVEQQYDPTADNHAKEQLLGVLDDYDALPPGSRIYLVNVATGLFAEAHGLYPWSLRDYSPREIDNLFIEDNSPVYVQEPTVHRGDLPDMPNTRTHWYPVPSEVIEDAHYKQFNLARSLTQGAATQEEAAALLVVWMQQSFFHAGDAYGWEVYLDGQEPRDDGGAVAYPLSIERIYEERVIGCHEPTILLEGMLHSLNIPAIRLMMHGHGVLYLPTVDRYVHGDHVAAYTDAPLGVLLLTPEEIRPFAENVGMIYDIIYQDKYRTPFLSMPLWRDGDYLYIHLENVRDLPDTTCIQVSDEDWARISQQLAAFNIRYDTQNCILSSDYVAIATLDELSTSSAP
jgi:hypothetical protein